MSDTQNTEAPETLEGWYVLHDVYRIDWPALAKQEPSGRNRIAGQATDWLASTAGEKGDTALYSVLGQKGDLMFLHYRLSPEDLNRAELGLRQLELYRHLSPAYSFVSVIEMSLYELTAIARHKLAEQGLKPGTEPFEAALAVEMEAQKQRAAERLFARIPEHRYVCFYPMSKRRGEQVNWYALGLEERRKLMRGHGRLGHKFHKQVKQVIGGSVGLDDWEWGVSLHSDDMLAFKKLVYEMRFDPASALYAEFGPFYLGICCRPEQLAALLEGRIEG